MCTCFFLLLCPNRAYTFVVCFYNKANESNSSRIPNQILQQIAFSSILGVLRCTLPVCLRDVLLWKNCSELYPATELVRSG